MVIVIAVPSDSNIKKKVEYEKLEKYQTLKAFKNT